MGQYVEELKALGTQFQTAIAARDEEVKSLGAARGVTEKKIADMELALQNIDWQDDEGPTS